MFLQGIAGTLELFHLSIVQLPERRRRGHGPAGRRVPAHRPGRPATCRIDERVLADTDTLMVFGLDHMVTEQEAPRRKSRRCAISSSAKERA